MDAVATLQHANETGDDLVKHLGKVLRDRLQTMDELRVILPLETVLRDPKLVANPELQKLVLGNENHDTIVDKVKELIEELTKQVRAGRSTTGPPASNDRDVEFLPRSLQ